VPDAIESASEQIGIVLADDHPLIRGGLRRVLNLEGGFSVVGEAGDVEGALALTRAHRPRVVVLDLNMPGEPTLPAIPRFVEANPGNYLDPSLGARLAQTPADHPERPPGLTHDDPKLAVGREFAGHRIDALVGRGGMGLVYRASDLVLNRTVALKVIAPEVAENPTYRARFERECRSAAALNHPHVIQIFHAGEESGLRTAAFIASLACVEIHSASKFCCET
jgi:CheY-like chemotaxis protein